MAYNLDYVREQQRKMLQQQMNPQPQTTEPTPQPAAPPAGASPDFAPPPQNRPQVEPGQAYTPPTPQAQGAPSTYDRAALSAAIQGKQFGGGSTDLNTQYNATDFINANQGGFAQGVTMVSPDKIRLPDGEIVDISRNVGAGGQGGAWWGSEKDWAAGEAAGRHQGSGSGGGGGGGGGGGSSSSLSVSGQGGNSAFRDQIRAMLLQQMQGLSAPTDENDPQIKGELQTAERLAERTRQDRRATAAERMAFQGLNAGGQGSGAFESELNAGTEDKGSTLQGVKGQLFAREAQAKRTQLGQMLNMALQSGDAESARELQMALAQMDAELKRQGMSQQQSQFNDSFGLQGGQFEYDKRKDKFLYGAGIEG